LVATSRINYVFWSIAVEWQIYFTVPFLTWAWRRYGATAVVVGTLVLGYAARIAFAGTRITRAHPQFLGMFALGMLAAFIARSPDPRFVRLRERLPWTLLAGLFLFAAIALATVWGVETAESRFYILDFPVGLMTMAALTASSGPRHGVLTTIFSWRPLVFIGTFSYSLYLIHAPLLQALWLYVLIPLGLSREAMLASLLTLGLGIILVLSYLFFLAFEAPFMGTAQKGATAASGTLPASP